MVRTQRSWYLIINREATTFPNRKCVQKRHVLDNSWTPLLVLTTPPVISGSTSEHSVFTLYADETGLRAPPTLHLQNVSCLLLWGFLGVAVGTQLALTQHTTWKFRKLTPMHHLEPMGRVRSRWSKSPEIDVFFYF